jgi:hypothetical protein
MQITGLTAQLVFSWLRKSAGALVAGAAVPSQRVRKHHKPDESVTLTDSCLSTMA